MSRQAKSEKAQRTRNRILNAAARCISEDGVFGFSTNRVAAIADVSIGSLYQYFDTKEALLHALIQQSHEAVLARLESVEIEGKGGVAAVTDLAISIVATGPESRLKSHLTYFEATLPFDPATHQLHDRKLAYLVEVLAEHRIPDPEHIAAEVLGLADALAGQDSLGDEGERRLRAAIAGYLAIVGLEDD